MSGFSNVFRSFWGSLVGLIALMLIIEHAGGVSKILGSSASFVGTTVKSFK